MANSFPGSGLAYADAFSVGTANAANSSLYVCSSCVQATRIEHTYSQNNLHQNTLWLRANNAGALEAASIGFTVVNDGGDHHRANIAATANAGQIGGNLALYTRNNNGNDNLGIFIDHAGNTGINTTSPNARFHVEGTSQFNDTLGFGQNGRISWGGSPAPRFIVTSCGGYNMVLATDNFVDRMTIQCGTGNVGIATSTPNSCTRVQINVTGAGCYGLMINKTDANESTIRFKSTHGCGSDYRIGASIYVDSAFEVAQQENGCSRFVIRCTGNVGIGTYTPRFSLDVAGGAMSNFYMSCCNASLDGIGPYDYGIIGSGNGAGALLINDIVGARYSATAGNYNLTFRKSVRNTAGACVYCTVMTFVGTTDTNCVPNVNIENRLGVGVASPSYRLHVNGTFYAAGSSQDYKEGICQYNTDSCLFMCLKPKTYQYKDEWKHLGKELKSGIQIGLIAEEVAEVMPELAVLVNEEENKVVRNVDYEKLSIVLLAEVQKLRQEVDQLKNK